MGDQQERLGAVNLGPFVSVDFNLSPTVYITVIVLTRRQHDSNQTKSILKDASLGLI